MQSDTLERIQKIIADVLNTDPKDIRTEASLKDDLGATSLDRFTILMDIEESFSLNLDDVSEDELEQKIATVTDIVAFVSQRTK